MNRFKLTVVAAVLATAFLAGCGGGGGDATAIPPEPGISESITALLNYMNSLIAMGENSELVDVNALTLVTNDTVESTSF